MHHANVNLGDLSRNSYPGRGIVIGTSQDGRFAVQVYWIMGRKPNSRNRVFKSKGGQLFTEPVDPAQVKDSSLIIYKAMDEYRGRFVVSNGDQTDTVVKKLGLHNNATLSETLVERLFEPDAPNFTSRITGLCSIHMGTCSTTLSLIRKSSAVASVNQCERFYYEYDSILPALGICFHTYMEDGDPLPAFNGEPYHVPLDGPIDEVVETYWSSLDKDNRVSLAVKFIELATSKSKIKVINRFTQVGSTVV